MSLVKIAPSLLASDFSRLGEEVRAVAAAGADYIHLDVMDGHFVPNLTVGPMVAAAIRPCTDLPIDTHLMISPADPFIAGFIDAGVDILTIHPEAGPHMHRTLQTIRGAGVKTGIALNPGTPIEAVHPVLDMLDLILVMTVNPGFGGQAFIPSQLEKIRKLKALVDASGYNIAIEVDGGVNAETAPAVIEAGADILVAGSAVFRGGAEQYADNIATLRNAE